MMVVAATTSAIHRDAVRRPLKSAKVTDEPVRNTTTARVIRIAPPASRRRPEAGSATPSREDQDQRQQESVKELS